MEPTIARYGPYRVIGMRYIGRNDADQIPQLWSAPGGFISRMGEIASPPEAKYLDSDRHAAYGLCRCVPGAEDAVEYIAAVSATATAPVPDGMVEATIAGATYAAFPVTGLGELGAVWSAARTWVLESAEWAGYCEPGECLCATHPAFELYPPDFGLDGGMFVYVPVRPANA